MRRAFALAGVCALALLACPPQPQLECDDGRACATGLVCVAGRCANNDGGVTNDAGVTSDGGITSDGGASDGGHAGDGGADSAHFGVTAGGGSLRGGVVELEVQLGTPAPATRLSGGNYEMTGSAALQQ